MGRYTEMLLYRKRYVPDVVHENDKYSVKMEKNGKSVYLENVLYVVEELMYWENASAIHDFFIEQCGMGEDDCRPLYVGEEDLLELKRRVDKVLGSVKLVKGKISNGFTYNADGKREHILIDGKYIADEKCLDLCRELLPTSGKDFYANTEYDERYVDELKDTRKMLDKLILHRKIFLLTFDTKYAIFYLRKSSYFESRCKKWAISMTKRQCMGI